MKKRTEGDRPSPFSVRLTPCERAQIEQAAGDMPLGVYVRSVLLGERGQRRRNAKKAPVQDQRALAEVLARLGQSRLSSNVNQLAKAANSGSLPVNPDTEVAIKTACAELKTMRRLLMSALGLRTE